MLLLLFTTAAVLPISVMNFRNDNLIADSLKQISGVLSQQNYHHLCKDKEESMLFSSQISVEDEISEELMRASIAWGNGVEKIFIAFLKNAIPTGQISGLENMAQRLSIMETAGYSTMAYIPNDGQDKSWIFIPSLNALVEKRTVFHELWEVYIGGDNTESDPKKLWTKMRDAERSALGTDSLGVFPETKF